MKPLLLCSIVLGLLALAPLQPGHSQPVNPPPAQTAPPPARNAATTSEAPPRQSAAAPSASSSSEAVPPAKSSVAGAEMALDIVLVLDNSGSMKQNDPRRLTRQVVTQFLEGMGANTRLAMIVFDQEPHLIEPLTALDNQNAKARLRKGLDGINYQGRYTDSPAAIERALYELKSHGREQAGKILIFLTDGIVDTGDKARDREKEQWLKDNLTAESRKLGIRLFTIAFTERADYQFIQTLALNTAGEYFRAYQAEDIEGVFKTIESHLTAAPATQATQVLASTAAPVQPPAVSPSAPANPPPAAPGSPLATASPPPPGPSLPLLLAGGTALVGIIIALALVMRRGPRVQPRGGGSAPVAGAARETPPPQAEVHDRAPVGPDERGMVREAPLPQAELLDLKGVAFQGSVRLTQSHVRIGRDPGNDIVIPDGGVSALHATLRYQDGAFYLEDQRSSNGTWLNDDKQRLEPHRPIQIKSGDRIRFNTCEFKFLAAQQPAAGGTILTQGGAHGPSGTILNPPSEKAPATPSGPDRAAPAEPPPRSEQPVSQGTRLKIAMCPHHPAFKATELCDSCGKPFCKVCVSEQEGKILCVECREKIA